MMIASLLATALLFGGMVLYSFGFAAFLFKNLPEEKAGHLLRRAFPHFYLFVGGVAAIAAAVRAPSAAMDALVLAAIAVTVIPTRQVLMPAINAASDAGDKRRFGMLHGASVLITLAHIGLAGWVLVRFLP